MNVILLVIVLDWETNGIEKHRYKANVSRHIMTIDTMCSGLLRALGHRVVT